MNPTNENYDVVYYANGLLDAETIKLFLESQGLEAMVTQESAGVTYGLTIGPLGEARVWVPKSQVAEALALIHQMEEGKFINDDSSDATDPSNSDKDD